MLVDLLTYYFSKRWWAKQIVIYTDHLAKINLRYYFATSFTTVCLQVVFSNWWSANTPCSFLSSLTVWKSDCWNLLSCLIGLLGGGEGTQVCNVYTCMPTKTQNLVFGVIFELEGGLQPRFILYVHAALKLLNLKKKKKKKHVLCADLFRRYSYSVVYTRS